MQGPGASIHPDTIVSGHSASSTTRTSSVLSATKNVSRWEDRRFDTIATRSLSGLLVFGHRVPEGRIEMLEPGASHQCLPISNIQKIDLFFRERFRMPIHGTAIALDWAISAHGDRLAGKPE